jgi:hypothetical protein
VNDGISLHVVCAEGGIVVCTASGVFCRLCAGALLVLTRRKSL